jgi:hypothetical protein
MRRLLLGIAVLALVSLPAIALAVGTFTDVPDDHTHAAGIGYVADTGITTGCTATKYCPGDALTRAQMATFLHRASGNAPGIAPSVNARTVSAGAVTTVEASNAVTNATVNTASVACPAGTVVVGGGGLSGSFGWALQDSHPSGSNSWSVLYEKLTSTPANHTAYVYARCLRVGP